MKLKGYSNRFTGNIIFVLIFLLSSNHILSQNKVVGYYADWMKSELPASKMKFENLTHIIQAFAWPESDGSISMGSNTIYPELISAAHAADVKILLAFGGWGHGDGFADMTANPDARATFIDNVINLMNTYGYDGIDLDWEFPENTTEAQNLVLLAQELRSRFDQYDPPLLLGMATNPGSWVGGRMKYEDMIGSLDWFAMMGYDFHGSWTTHAGHNAPLYAPSTDWDGSVHDGIRYLNIARSIPKEKLLLGVPFYGKEFTAPGLYEAQTGVTDIRYNSVVSKMNSGSYNYFWDFNSEVPFLLNTAGTKFVTFADTTSIRIKVEYAKENNLGGMMIWALGQDLVGGSQPLLEAIGYHMGLTDPTAINSEVDQLADNYELYNNYPNPFNPSTTIQYKISSGGLVKLKIYNSLGAEISTLVDEEQSAGIHSVTFHAQNLASGIYFYELVAGEFRDLKKMLLVK
jgi:chitinase